MAVVVVGQLAESQRGAGAAAVVMVEVELPLSPTVVESTAVVVVVAPSTIRVGSRGGGTSRAGSVGNRRLDIGEIAVSGWHGVAW